MLKKLSPRWGLCCSFKNMAGNLTMSFVWLWTFCLRFGVATPELLHVQSITQRLKEKKIVLPAWYYQCRGGESLLHLWSSAAVQLCQWLKSAQPSHLEVVPYVTGHMHLPTPSWRVLSDESFIMQFHFERGFRSGNLCTALFGLLKQLFHLPSFRATSIQEGKKEELHRAFRLAAVEI